MFLDKINKKRDEIIYEIGRKKFINDVIANIGEVKEYEDRIICYVKQDLLDTKAKPNFYHLDLYGMNTHYEKSKEIVDYYKLDKPVHYIFDGITFDVPIILSSYFCTVTFTNCNFLHSYFNIYHADKLNFGENKYYDGTSIVGGGTFLRTISSAKIGELCFRNEHFINEYELKKYGENNFGIDVTADKVDIVNSTIVADENHGQINIKAKKTNIGYSKIYAPEIYLDSDSIVFTESLLKSDGIIIENKNCDCDTEVGFYNVDSPYTVYNGHEIITKEKNLKEKRQELTRVLRNIKARCDIITNEKLEKAKVNIEPASIKQLIKK